MGILTVVLLVIIFTLAGFILGALVYRNNSKQLNNIILTMKDMEEQIKRLKK